jgi:site-specific recombinase XerD
MEGSLLRAISDSLPGKGDYMIEKYFKKPETWDRIRACWLFEQIERYIVWLNEQGYTPCNVYRRVPILLSFAAFAWDRGGRSVRGLPRHVQPFIDRYLRDRRKHITSKRTRSQIAGEARVPVEQMMRMVLPGFIGSGDRRRPFPFESEVPGFLNHLRQERGVTPKTVESYSIILRSFETYLMRIGLSAITDLSPSILTAFVTERGLVLGKASIAELCSLLRVFLRYAHREKLIARDLSGGVHGPRNYRLATIPRSIPWADVQRMLDAVDRRSACGKRDYAILLLLVTYGLRSREVAGLTLDDLDWPQERLRVPERKAGHSTAYPMSPIVGEAIVDYLKDGRPQTKNRSLFFRIPAPQRPCGAACVSNRASYYLAKAGIAVPRPGSHTLRHACIQRLVDARFSLKTIGDYVGHASPNSTRIYAKVDVESLRELALGQGEAVL